MSKELMRQLLRDEGSGHETDAKVVEASRGLFKEEVREGWQSIKEELGHLGKLGAHELAAALFTNSAFVMYPKAGQESVEQEPLHGIPIEPLQKEVERGGMEM